jgi:hypothetical protein
MLTIGLLVTGIRSILTARSLQLKIYPLFQFFLDSEKMGKKKEWVRFSLRLYPRVGFVSIWDNMMGSHYIRTEIIQFQKVGINDTRARIARLRLDIPDKDLDNGFDSGTNQILHFW